MHAETIISFKETDEDAYTLVYEDDDGDTHSLSMGTFEAARLYSLLQKTHLGEWIEEMNEARASYERGDGPNGEPPGTWENGEFENDELANERDLCPIDWRELVDLSYKAMKENQ